jgi:hypothetical protein
MRQHVATHILAGDCDSSVCGFCGQEGSCNSYMDKGSKSGVVPVSDCPYFHKFHVKVRTGLCGSLWGVGEKSG